MATKEVLRTVQPAHKSERITTAKARKAWLAVERASRSKRRRAATKPTAGTGRAGEPSGE